MGSQHSIPIVSFILALVTFVALLLLQVDLALAIAVVVLWIGSLLLATSRSPDLTPVTAPTSFSTASMRELIENASTPLLVTEGETISIANQQARKVLGQHIVGQDTRMAFRQPAAISLLGKKRSGRALIRGLVRRRDIWQINRQAVDAEMAVIELINRTSEADIGRAHTDFVANASHELRTPLAGIIGYAETLSETPEDIATPTAQKFLATIQREAQRMQSLVSDLMSLSRIEAEKHDAPEDVVDLKLLVERAARDAAGQERLERLTLDLAGDTFVQGDEKQLEQLVRNLVDNALKYGDADKPISVELAHARDDYARLTVANQGEGIDPEHLPHLTRRFYRTDPGRSRASGGTGLGLAIVKHIVERHKGRLDIQSELGQGARVIVRIPLLAKDAEENAEPAQKNEIGESIDNQAINAEQDLGAKDLS